jgi:hypothetical protein
MRVRTAVRQGRAREERAGTEVVSEMPCDTGHLQQASGISETYRVKVKRRPAPWRPSAPTAMATAR